MLVLSLISAPLSAQAYNKDSHYYLRFTLSLTTCFDWSESHLIASGDWGMDENDATHAEMNPVQRHNKINWHAFGHSDPRFQELWLRTIEEPDLDMRLIKLGQFMHYLEDWEAHAGYGVRLGHARDTFRGRDPDSLASSSAKNYRMVQSALDHLLATCEDLERLDTDRDQQLIEIMQALYDDNLLQDLLESSDPAWKKGKTGGMRPVGYEVMRANKTRLEVFIESNIQPLPGKNIPEDFETGSDHGIPESLNFPFDQDGNISDLRTDLKRFRETAAEEPLADISLTVGEVQTIHRGHSANRKSGWRLQVIAANVGNGPSAAGDIEVFVVDSEDENVVAQTTEPLPVLQPDESKEFQISVSSPKRPESDVIIGAFARSQDSSAMNDGEWIMLGDAEEEQPEIPLITDLDPQSTGAQTISFLADPKWLVIDDQACVLVNALVSGGDSTEKLDNGAIELLGGVWDEFSFEDTIPNRWSAIATDSGLVGGKTFSCFVPTAEAIEAIRGLQPEALKIAVTLEADKVDPHTKIFQMDEQFYRAIMQLGGQPPESLKAE